MNKYQLLRRYTCSGFCKTSYHLIISPPPTNLPNSLPAPCHSPSIPVNVSYWRETFIKLTTSVASIHAHYTRYFPAKGSTNPDVFQSKTFSIPRGIIPQNFRSLGFAISEELGNIQTDAQTHSLTDWCFDREIIVSVAVLEYS